MKIKDKLKYFFNDHGIVWMSSPPDDFEARVGYPVRESDYPVNKLVEKLEIWVGLLPKRADIDSYNSEEDVSHLYRWRVPNLLTGGEHIFPASLKRQEEVLPAAKLEQRRYKAGWQVSTAFIVQSAALAAALLLVGYWLYQEPLAWNKVMGVAICLVGLVVINFR